MLLGRETCRVGEVLGMKMGFLWAGKCRDGSGAAVPRMLNQAVATSRADVSCVTSRYGASAHPHKLAGSGPESRSPNPPAGQHVEMMFGVMDVLAFSVSSSVKPRWKIRDALRRQRDE